MTHTITLIPGDGIGPEVSDAGVRILATAGVDIRWERHEAGADAFEKTGDALPPALLLSAILMLRHLGESSHAEIIPLALERVLTGRGVRTRDLGGTATTSEYAAAICREMAFR